MRRWLVLMAMIAVGCAEPVDGVVPEGAWGAEHFELRVTADGSAVLEGDCAHAVIDSLQAVDGEVDVDVEWVFEGGPVQDTAAEDGTAATLTGTATRRVMKLTLSAADDSFHQDMVLREGVDGSLFKCQ